MDKEGERDELELEIVTVLYSISGLSDANITLRKKKITICTTKYRTHLIAVGHAFLIMCQRVDIISTAKRTEVRNVSDRGSLVNSVCDVFVHLHKLQVDCVLFGYEGNLVLCEPFGQHQSTVPLQEISSHLIHTTNAML